jgi:hypothetical protein
MAESPYGARAVSVSRLEAGNRLRAQALWRFKKEARLQPLIFRWKKHAEAVFIDGLHVSLVR